MRWGKPDQDGKGRWVLFERYVIGPEDNPYMIRWRLFECPLFRIYLHKICRSDDDRHLHDHPFNFVSIILRGGYDEYRPHVNTIGLNVVARRRFLPPTFVVRKATDLHRLDLIGKWIHFIGEDRFEKVCRPAWTLVFAGRRLRQWGFQTEQGWVDHKQYAESW